MMRSTARNATLAASVLLCGALVGLATEFLQRRAESREAGARFDDMAALLEDEVAARMRTYEYGLRGLRGAVVAAGGQSVTRQQVHGYSQTRDIEHEFQGARGFGVVMLVPPDKEAAFATRLRRTDWPDFKICRLASHAGDSEVIAFVEPLDVNRPAIGLDIASEPRRHAAARAAMATGKAQLTAPITLVQAASAPQRGFLLLLPMFRPGLPTATPEQRDAAAIGWTYTPLVSDEVLGSLNFFDGELALTVSDEGDGAAPPFFDSAAGLAADSMDGTPVRRASLPIYGRKWKLEIRATPAFGADRHVSGHWRLAGIASLLAILLATSAIALVRAHARQRRDRHEIARRAAIVESSEDAIVAETLDGVIIEWNLGAERMFGYAAAEALGRIASELILPRDRHGEDAEMRNSIAQGQRLAPFDTTRLRRDGTLIDVSITAAPILDGDGTCIGFAKTLRDTREAQRARRALSELNDSLESQVLERTARLDIALRDLQTILDNVPSMIAYWDSSMVNRMANKPYADWLDTTPEQLRGRILSDVIEPSYLETLKPAIAATLAGTPQTFERSIARDGESPRHFLVHYHPDIIGSAATGFYVLVHDVTDITENQRKLADALRENAGILQTLDRHALVSVADRAGRIIGVNDSFCRVSGYTEQELRGQNHRIVNSGTHERAFWQQMWGTISHGKVWRGEVCNRAKDGTLYWVDSVIAPFLDAQGRIEKYISIRTDITPIKRLQQEAEQAKARAMDASHAKGQFLANMSHEIRTPLNAVLGLSYLLQKTALSAEQSDFVGKIGLAGRALLSLVNDILDLSKIEAAEMKMEHVPFSLRDVVSEVSAVVSTQAMAKGIRLEVDVSADLPDGVVGDPTRLRQVLLNLLGNAVKFTEQGFVGLHVDGTPATTSAKGEERHAFRFRVRDSGIGIAPDQLAVLFRPFVQADTSTTRRFGGTGLGLSIVKDLVGLMGGCINVESTTGNGSVFSIDIEWPLADAARMIAARGGTTTPSLQQALQGVSALVVDDSDINLEVARRILEDAGAVVELARDGREAVELLRVRPEAFDVVLMDVQMPRLDGHGATQLIRRELQLLELPVYALTAGMTAGERERADSAGMNGVLGKPFDPPELIRFLCEVVRGEAPPAAAAPIVSAAPANWPRLDGIDSQDVWRRTGGSEPLLRTLLARFLLDTDSIDAWMRGGAELGRSELAAALHNLKGIAGTIGANELAHQAGHSERKLLVDGESLPRADEFGALEMALSRVRLSSRRFLGDVDAAPPVEASGAEVAKADWSTLMRQLADANFEALETARKLAVPLSALLGEALFRKFITACDDLDFEVAANLLSDFVVDLTHA